MQLYQDDLIYIELHAGLSCVTVQWQDMEFFNISDYELAFHKLMDLMQMHQVKNIILDMSHSQFGPPEKFFNPSIDLLMSGLGYLEVEKLARVSSRDEIRENRFHAHAKNLISGMQLTLNYQLFPCRNTALEWVSC